MVSQSTKNLNFNKDSVYLDKLGGGVTGFNS
jgi:hypothetical protein